MKRQYIIGIAVGIFIGSVVALFLGNNTTAVLVGTIAIFAITWSAGLQWGVAKEFSTELLGKMKKMNLEPLYRGAGKILWIAIICIPYYVIYLSLVRVFYKIPKRVKRDVAFRKLVVYFLTLLLITMIVTFVDYIMFYNTVFADVNFGSVPVTFLFIVLVILLVPSLTLLISLTVIFMFVDNKESVKKILYSKVPLGFLEEIMGIDADFIVGWIYDGIIDDRNASASVFYMLKTRIRNGLMMLAFPFILIPYGFLALATHYTAFYAFIATISGVIHLSISYHFGWIELGNMNFILSVAVAMLFGCTVGWMIGGRVDVPEIKVAFRKHMKAIAQ